ncbi:MAG: hypothetical protein IPK82_07860 [Polyangiaceae bacterium]|nr:hypothetical protein [Polyangiaceae bacterium]
MMFARAVYVYTVAIVATVCCACGSQSDGSSGDVTPSLPPSVTASSQAAPPVKVVLDPNPLKLPPVSLKLDGGKRVLAVPQEVLANAALGSTFVLSAATVVGFDGDLLVLEGKSGSAYKLHPAYAIAIADDAKVRPSDPVVIEHQGNLRHGVIKKYVKDRLTVRLTDGDSRVVEVPMKTTRVMRQQDGLYAGNYAALGDADGQKHVLLVSSFEDGGEKKWLALGAGGAAMVVNARSLEAIPVKFQPRVGASVLAAHNGVMRKATVTGASEQGIVTVKYERAGRPATVGWGFFMPLANEKKPAK